MTTARRMKFDTIQDALGDRKGQGGWFFWNQSDGSGQWFDMMHTQDDVLKAVRGVGLIGLWGWINAKLSGPTGGPRGKTASI